MTVFFHLVLKKVNTVVLVTISMIHMQKKMCVPDVLKNLNVRVLNLISRTNETRHIKWHETCKCNCRLDTSAIISKGGMKIQCEAGEYLDYENCKCRKRLLNKLVEECTKNVEGVKLVGITLFEHENVCKCSSCKLYITLFSLIVTITIAIGTYFVYYKYMNHAKENVSRYDYVYQATNY